MILYRLSSVGVMLYNADISHTVFYNANVKYRFHYVKEIRLKTSEARTVTTNQIYYRSDERIKEKRKLTVLIQFLQD